MQRSGARSARLLGAAIALLTLVGCAAGSDGGADFAKVCAAQGLTPGTDAFTDCVEQHQLEQQMELQRIHQAREAARGGTKL
jgi:hypothetical protein